MDSNVAPVWLAKPHTGGPLLATLVAMTTAIAKAPTLMSLSHSPHSSDSCLKKVITCELSPLGFHLNGTIKDKIWKGDYVDIQSLLPLNKDYRVEKKESGRFEDEKRRTQLAPIILYASVLGEKHPELCCGLFQHVERIPEAYKTFPVLGLRMMNPFIRNCWFINP